MKPGSELDALVAEKVMGWGVVAFSDHPDWEYLKVTRLDNNELSLLRNSTKPRDYRQCSGEFPKYSTDIAAAWEILEKFNKSTQAVELIVRQHFMGHWFCHIKGAGDLQFLGEFDGAMSASHAICLAALETVK